MNYSDLCKEVCALGFENDIEIGDALLFSARRAINAIYNERPVYKTAELYQNPILTSDRIKKLFHNAGDECKIEFNAKAYSFTTSGIGKFIVSDLSGIREYEFSGAKTEHKGFLYGKGEIIFSGDFFYTVYDITLFSQIYGPDEFDIPPSSQFIEYELKRCFHDFLTPASMPTDELRCAIPGAYIYDGIMRIPSEYSGKIFLIYKKVPVLPNGDPDEYIELPEGCEHLFSLLVASYFWLDDDSEKSQYYHSLYKDGMASVRVHGPSHMNSAYKNTNGWA